MPRDYSPGRSAPAALARPWPAKTAPRPAPRTRPPPPLRNGAHPRATTPPPLPGRAHPAATPPHAAPRRGCFSFSFFFFFGTEAGDSASQRRAAGWGGGTVRSGQWGAESVAPAAAASRAVSSAASASLASSQVAARAQIGGGRRGQGHAAERVAAGTVRGRPGDAGSQGGEGLRCDGDGEIAGPGDVGPGDPRLPGEMGRQAPGDLARVRPELERDAGRVPARPASAAAPVGVPVPGRGDSPGDRVPQIASDHRGSPVSPGSTRSGRR